MNRSEQTQIRQRLKTTTRQADRTVNVVAARRTPQRPFSAASVGALFSVCLAVPIILAALIAWCRPVLADSPPLAFGPGERLTFELRWMFIPAGEAVLEVQPMAAVDGRPARHFAMTVRTNAFVDAFYKVRDRIEAWTDTEMTRSLRYAKLQREGRHRMRDVTVAFDWPQGQATYTNRGEVSEPIALLPGTFDPLAAFYFTRRVALAPGAVILRPVTDGRKNVVGRARVVGRERIRVAAGTFETIMVEPDLRDVTGVFEKSPEGRIRIWLSDDGRHLPVRIESKVVVGHFTGELVAAEGLAAATDPRWP